VQIPNFLIYGSNGYTGSLIAREAVMRGMRPLLAGRNADALAPLARELNLEHRVFALQTRRRSKPAFRVCKSFPLRRPSPRFSVEQCVPKVRREGRFCWTLA
jgi:hypothetical protein